MVPLSQVLKLEFILLLTDGHLPTMVTVLLCAIPPGHRPSSDGTHVFAAIARTPVRLPRDPDWTFR
jgi:hypothetical protein